METNEENNKVSEPELAYGQRRKTTIPLEEIVRKYPWLKDYPDYREEWEAWTTAQPYTREELRTRIDETQAAIDSGAKGMSKEELFRHFERIKQCAHAYECHHLGES